MNDLHFSFHILQQNIIWGISVHVKIEFERVYQYI